MPGTVKAALALIYFSVASMVLTAIVVLADPAIRDRRVPIRHAHAVDPTRTYEPITLGYFVAIPLLITVVVFVLLARDLRKGSRTARVVTWVWMAATVLLLVPSGSAFRSVGGVGGLVLAIAVSVLLAAPASRPYFRRR